MNFAGAAGLTYDQMRERFGMDRPLTPAMLGAAAVRLVTDLRSSEEIGFKVSPEGLQPMSDVVRLSHEPVAAH